MQTSLLHVVTNGFDDFFFYVCKLQLTNKSEVGFAEKKKWD